MLTSRLLSPLRRFWRIWRSYLLFIVCVWIPVRSVIADYNPVPSGSMNPTIVEGDVVFVNKLAYELRVPLTLHRIARWADPARGDIVVAFSPVDGTRLVKRVIAIPGDTIAMTNNRVTINGTPLTYAPPRTAYGETIPRAARPFAVFAEENLTGAEHAVMALPRALADRRTFATITVPAGQFFVMGDNRDNSSDSRYFGFVERDAIIGEVKGIIVSWDIEDSWLPRPERFFTALR